MTARIRKPSTIVAVAAFAAFLATFNETFLNVAFAPIMADLGVDVSTVQWLATAYMLGAAVMVPVSAFAYRSVPTRPLFVGTVALLVVGSVIGALAPNFPVLLAGRIVQALGTGLLIPIGMNITLEVVPREKLGTYMGIMGAMTTLGPPLSVIVAGVLLAVFSWHMLMAVFAVFAVLTGACLVFGVVMLGDIAKLTRPKLDAPSVALVGLALIGLMYGVSTVFSGSIAVAVGAAVAGAALLALFVRRQRRLEQPLIDAVRLFTERGISGAPVVDACGNAVGFVSDGDVMRALADQTPAFKSAYSFVVERGNADFDRTVAAIMGQPVTEIATPHVISVNLHDELGGVCKVLADKHLKKAPVLDGGRMAGIVNRSNIARYSMTSYLDGISQEAS